MLAPLNHKLRLRRIRIYKFFLIFLFGITVGGCQHPHCETPAHPRQPHSTWLNPHYSQAWQLKGRVAIRDTQQSRTANIVWQQNGDDYDILLTNPMAAQTLHITPTNIHDSCLTEIPTTQLRYWLKGIPSPQTSVQTAVFDDQQRLISLQQDGWQIEYLSYTTYHSTTMPQKIVATKDGISVKLKIQSWTPCK